ncbi:MAG TPA: SDR family oxidoreductase, partial [Cytophagales bacterium]|nr:SDR family oxidoreductase [Cytophagales bacterium]
AHVVMACRRPEAGKEAAKTFGELRGSYAVMRCDLADLDSVRKFVADFLGKYNHLEGLMCNAGAVIMGNDVQYTKDGFEMTMGVNYFGHFLLVELLLDILKQSAPARIGLLSSVVHAGSPKNRYEVHLDDMEFKSRKYSAFAAYGEAKVATVQYALELADRLKGTGVTTASIHPGWARSNFGGGGAMMKIMRVVMLPFRNSMTNSNEESAQTSLHVLISDDAPKHSGAYFSQHSVLYRDKECRPGGWPMQSPNPHARDLAAAKALVQRSYQKVGYRP